MAKTKRDSSWLCERCGAQFKDNALYKQHRVDHMQGRIPDKKVDPVSGEEIPTKKDKPEVKPVPTQSAAQIKDAKPKKISLKYVFEGNCECGAKVDTLELDVGSDNTVRDHVVLAWCQNCKKQLRQRSVKKL